MPPCLGACGRGCAPVPQILMWGEDCLSEASSAALTTGTGAKVPEGPRPGANGFGSFCRNKRTSSCGDETPRPFPRRVGTKPHKEKIKTLDASPTFVIGAPVLLAHDKEGRAGPKPRNHSFLSVILDISNRESSVFVFCIHTYDCVRTPAHPLPRTPQIPEWSFPKMNRIDNVQCDSARPQSTNNKTTNKKKQ